MRVVFLALAALLACARLGGSRDGDDEREVRVAAEPLTAEQQTRLTDHARAGGLLWWRLPGDAGPRCEPWRLVPDPGDLTHGHLLLTDPPPVPTDSPPDPRPPADPDPSSAPEDSQAHQSHVPKDSRTDPSSAPEDSQAHQSHVPKDSRTGSSSVLEASPPLPPPLASPGPPIPVTLLAAPAPTARLAWPRFPPVPEASPAPASPPAPSDMSSGTLTIQLDYSLAEGHLTLTAPEHERLVPAPEGTKKSEERALTCVFTGIALGGPAGGPRRLILAARERFFFTRDACDAAGFADDPPGPDELRVLGCAGALADPATRARLERPPPRDAPDAAARLHRARAVHHLRRGSDGALVCDVWRNRPERARGHGRLEHRGRDDDGRFVRTYAYDVGPGYLTLQGPAEFRRIDLAGQRTDIVRASSCLVTRGVAAVGPTAIDLGGERWYLSRSACDAARLAGAPAPVGPVPLLVAGCE
ncbi:hypothetical protein [Nannocystis bainbridge]|uniref:Uncharacterized protein n=1 Tax=Nannocystis bainbridge TaxID=2995303 RepID=A0ABT5E8T8_9BACT|nr:hypothetical protein [Nannocystis bainbridge]MDC0721323.1 hypothetical protein [Nannocystis bainbridge]